MRRMPGYLSKRQQQIMEIVYKKDRVTATDVEEGLPDKLSNSTVRTQLRILESEGHLRHIEENGRYVYIPTQAKSKAAKKVLQSVTDTFFAGSVGSIVTALLGDDNAKLSADEADKISEMIAKARKG